MLYSSETTTCNLKMFERVEYFNIHNQLKGMERNSQHNMNWLLNCEVCYVFPNCVKNVINVRVNFDVNNLIICHVQLQFDYTSIYQFSVYYIFYCELIPNCICWFWAMLQFIFNLKAYWFLYWKPLSVFLSILKLDV